MWLLGNGNLQQQRYLGLMTSGVSRDEFRELGQRTPEHLVTRSFRVTTFTFGLLSGYSPVTFGLLSGYLVVTWGLPCGYHLVTRRSQSGCRLVALQLGLLRSDVPLVVCCC